MLRHYQLLLPLLLLSVVPLAQAQNCTDESDISYPDGTKTATYGTGNDIGQSFTAPCDGLLNAVELDIVSFGAETAGTLYIMQGELNTGTVLASQSFTITQTGVNRFELASPVVIANGSVYTLLFDFTSGNFSMRYYGSSPYAGGHAWQQSGVNGAPPRAGASSISSVDLDFTADLSGGALPVELVSFTATLDGPSALLRWQTASETNNAGFDIEHRQGSDSVQTLGFVAGRGTTAETSAYRFAAEGLQPGTHVFRLKQVDFDGAIEYSPEVEVSVEAAGVFSLTSASPNPFSSQSQFWLSVASAQQVSVGVYDVLGRQVAMLLDEQVEAGSHELAFEAGSLPAGIYVIRAEGERFTSTQQVTLVR